MSGNQIGGKRARDINLANDPQFYRKIGRIGGKAKVPKGFAISGKAREAGAKGGSMRAGRKYPRTTPAFTETFTETDTLVPIKKSRFKLFRRK